MPIDHVCLSGTNMEKAMDFPSGDHRGARGASVVCVTCVGGPSISIHRTKIWAPFGSPSATYRILLPSGDHRALDPFTRKRCCVLSEFTIHSAESHLSSILSTDCRV